MKKEKIQLKISKDNKNVAYLYLPKHPKKLIKGLVKKQIRLLKIIENYKGPDIFLDFDEEENLIGFEVLD